LWLLVAVAAAAFAAPAKHQELNVPLEFEANRGQFAPEVLFLSRTANHFIYLTRDGMTFGSNGNSQRGAALQMKLAGANPGSAVAPESRLTGTSNYYIGNDPTHWQRAVPHFARVRYQAVWPGIDLVFHGRDGSLEYDFKVSPGADPSAIRLRYANAGKMTIDPDGNLSIETASGTVLQRLPEIYQESGGKRAAVHGVFQIAGDREVRFQLDAYDRRQPLVIDPTVTYSTYIGGTGTMSVSKIAVDGTGNLYVAGSVSSPDFPLVHPIQQFSTNVGLFHSADQGSTWGPASTAIGTAKISALASDPSNPAVAYAASSRGVFKTTNSGAVWTLSSTGLPNDEVTSIALDPLTPATLYACTREGFFKTTDGAATWQLLADAGSPSVVTVDGKTEGTIWLGYSFGSPAISYDGGKTYLLANILKIVASAIAVDPTNSNNVFFGSPSLGLLMTKDGGHSVTVTTAGLQSTVGAAVSVNAIAINPHNPAQLLVGTNTGVYLSNSSGLAFQATQGLGNRTVLSVLFDSKSSNIALAGTAGGGVFVSTDSGMTWKGTGPANLDVNALAMSADEKSTWSALYSGANAFVTKIDPTGASIVFSTFLGGSGQSFGLGLAADQAGHSFVCGSTDASDFPAPHPVQHYGGGIDMFITRLGTSGALEGSTYLGGHADDDCKSIVLDPAGNVYVAGASTLLNGGNSDFPTTPGVFGAHTFGGQDCVVAKLDNGLLKLIYSTFLGGNNSDSCYGVAVDASGNAYVVGGTFSSNFLVTKPPLGGTKAIPSNTNTPAFVTKLSPDASAILYSALLGGLNGATQPISAAVDAAGRLYVAGYTYASDYPLTSDALDKTAPNPYRGVLTVIESDASKLVYSTFLPGYAFGLALDLNGNVWLTGGDSSGTFPTTPDALAHAVAAGATTPWVAEVDTVHSKILHATYLAGSAGGAPADVARGSDGSIYVAGTTLSTDFATTGTPFSTAQTTNYTSYLMRLVFSSGTGANAPSIAAVVSGASFQNGITPGAFMTITGTNLSTQTDSWVKSIVNSELPTVLDGVKVTVAGKPAYVSFISSTQINAVAPDVPPGPVSVTVTNGQLTSAGFNAVALAEQPAFFLFNGAYAVATHFPDFSLAIKNGTFAGLTTVAAKPGDVIILWGTGFGPSNPAAPAGALVPAGTFSSANPVTVKVGGTAATVYGAALASGFAALYQVAIQIPTSLADGDYPVVATVNGQSSPSTTLITVMH
jgi:uncharacterized protein (TIGR03437 family)